MSRAAASPSALEAGVVIERIRVVTGARGDRAGDRARPARAEQETPAQQREDHRIIVEELRIEADALMSHGEAKTLGSQVAEALGASLGELQTERLEAISRERLPSGPVRIGSLRLRLRGRRADRPGARVLAAALVAAIEQRIRS